MELNDFRYEDIHVGQLFEFERFISNDDVLKFAELSGDYNPLHVDESYAKKTMFNGSIVHGMLAASLFSTLVGMVCPGKRNLYLSQSVEFKKPIYPNSSLKVIGKVKSKIDSFKLVVMGTEIVHNGSIMISGEAKVKMLDDYNEK